VVEGHTASAPCLISSASSSIANAGALNLDGPASDDMLVKICVLDCESEKAEEVQQLIYE